MVQQAALVRLLPTALLVTVGLLGPQRGLAQSLEGPQQGASTLALGGLRAVLASDPTALWGNPAAIPRAATNIALSVQLRADSRSVRPETEVVNAYDAPEARQITGITLTPCAALVAPLWRHRLWAGVGYREGMTLRSVYPAGPVPPRTDPGRYLGTELDLEQHLVSMALALTWSGLAIGAALELSHVRLAALRQTLWAGLPRDLVDPRRQPGTTGLDMDALARATGGLAAGGLFGIWFRPWSRIEVGLTLQLPVRCPLKGSLSLVPGEQAPDGFDTISAHSGEASLALELPLRLRGAIALDLRFVRLALEAALARWSQSAPLVADLEDAWIDLEGGQDERIVLRQLALGVRLRDQISVHLGLETPVWGDFLVGRLGYSFHRGATIAAFPSPTLLDLDHHELGLGLLLQAGHRWRLAAAVGHAFAATLYTADQRRLLNNPLDPAVTQPIGAGRYSGASTRVVFELQAGW